MSVQGRARRTRCSWVGWAPLVLPLLLLSVLAALPAGGGSAGVYPVCMGVAWGVLVLRVIRVTTGRGAWSLLAGGTAVLLASQGALLAASDGSPQVTLGALSHHSWWAVAGLGAYPFFYAAQMVLLRQRVQRLLPSAWLDGVFTTVLLMALAQAFIVPDLQARSGLGSVAASALVGRIALDVLMLCFAVANAAMVGWRSDQRLGLVVAAFALLLVSDIAGVGRLTGLLLHPLSGQPVVGPGVDTARFAALVLLACAAWREASPPGRAVSEGWPVLLAPTLGLLGSVALLGHHLHVPLPGIAPELALATIVLIGVKVLVLFREVLRLADSHRLALSDELTGLPNRRALLQELETATAQWTGSRERDGAPGRDLGGEELPRRAGRLRGGLAWARGGPRDRVSGRGLGLTRVGSSGEPAGALLVIDLDHFKDVNDSLGHGYGDRLLNQVAQRMRAAMPPTALLARLGGDEFAVILPGMSVEQAQDSAEELLQAMLEPFSLEVLTTRIGASIGVTAWPLTCPVLGRDSARSEDRQVNDHGDRREDQHALQQGMSAELLRQADAAMYIAKRGGGGVARYDETTGQVTRQRLQRLEELRTGIANGELVVHYQPQVDVGTGAVVGMEALVRWTHPKLGLLAPVHFVELAEMYGLMSQLTTTVLQQAVVAAASWHEAGFPVRVAVNLATSCLMNADLVPLVQAVLEETGFNPAALVLEITETTLMSDPEKSQATIESLLARGVSVSIDDYGTGYSSLAYLQDLPAAEVKLDRSFTVRLAEDARTGSTRTASIIASTAELAHSLGMRLLVEGVEDGATLERLGQLGVDETQGYHHARPMPALEVLSWLGGRSADALAASCSVRAGGPGGGGPGGGGPGGGAAADTTAGQPEVLPGGAVVRSEGAG